MRKGVRGPLSTARLQDFFGVVGDAADVTGFQYANIPRWQTIPTYRGWPRKRAATPSGNVKFQTYVLSCG